jgi:hypothetical protein
MPAVQKIPNVYANSDQITDLEMKTSPARVAEEKGKAARNRHLLPVGSGNIRRQHFNLPAKPR